MMVDGSFAEVVDIVGAYQKKLFQACDEYTVNL